MSSENTPWRPEGCPIARDQPHGYKHLHQPWCGASDEQVAADIAWLEASKLRKLRYLIRSWFDPRP